MPRVVLARPARDDLDRLRRHLVPRNARAAIRAVETILDALAALEQHPEGGRTLSTRWGLRELVIPFGDSGYLALYHFGKGANEVTVLGIRHQREF